MLALIRIFHRNQAVAIAVPQEQVLPDREGTLVFSFDGQAVQIPMAQTPFGATPGHFPGDLPEGVIFGEIVPPGR